MSDHPNFEILDRRTPAGTYATVKVKEFPMTPSKEALSAVAALTRSVSSNPSELATLIDAAFAEHRERVARLIEVATTAARCLPEWSSSRREISEAIAALEEHHEPETAPSRPRPVPRTGDADAMSDTPGLDRLKDLHQQLGGLLDPPHPGLLTWQAALWDVLFEMADYAGDGMISDKHPNKIREFLKGLW